MKLDRPIDIIPKSSVNASPIHKRKKRGLDTHANSGVSYWKTYHDQGGIMAYFSETAVCFQESDAERIEFIAQNSKCDST